MRLFFFCSLIFTILCLSITSAYAERDPDEGCELSEERMISFVSSGNGSIRVSPGVPIGSVIGTGQLRLAFYCAENITMFFTRLDYDGQSANPQKIYNTNISGVGMRIAIKNIVTDALNPPTTAAIGTRLRASPATPGVRFEATINIELVKTSDTTLNGALNGEALRLVFEENNEEILSTSFFFTPTLLSSAGCNVITKDIIVNMGCITVDQLMGKTPATLSTGLTIWLNCTVGTQALITFTDSANPANRSDILSLTADSTARGVGIRLSRMDNTTIFYSSEFPAVGMQSRRARVAASEQGGTIMIPLSARYVRTNEAVSAGSVKAVTTFTLAYQ